MVTIFEAHRKVLKRTHVAVFTPERLYERSDTMTGIGFAPNELAMAIILGVSKNEIIQSGGLERIVRRILRSRVVLDLLRWLITSTLLRSISDKKWSRSGK